MGITIKGSPADSYREQAVYFARKFNSFLLLKNQSNSFVFSGSEALPFDPILDVCSLMDQKTHFLTYDLDHKFNVSFDPS